MQSQLSVDFVGAAGDGDLELGLQPTPAYGHTTTGGKTRIYMLWSYELPLYK